MYYYRMEPEPLKGAQPNSHPREKYINLTSLHRMCQSFQASAYISHSSLHEIYLIYVQKQPRLLFLSAKRYKMLLTFIIIKVTFCSKILSTKHSEMHSIRTWLCVVRNSMLQSLLFLPWLNQFMQPIWTYVFSCHPGSVCMMLMMISVTSHCANDCVHWRTHSLNDFVIWNTGSCLVTTICTVCRPC